MDGVLLFQRGPIVKDFPARLQRAPENFRLLVLDFASPTARLPLRLGLGLSLTRGSGRLGLVRRLTVIV